MATVCDLPLSSRSVFSTRGEDIDRDFDGAPLPTFTCANAWFLTCRLAGAAISELVAIDADGWSLCFGRLFAFPWAAAQHDRAASLRGGPRPRPLWGAATHPAAGTFCSADIHSATWGSVHL